MDLGPRHRARLGPRHDDDRELAEVFSDDPRIGYFEQRSVYQTALDDGEVLAPATTAEQMQQVVTNSTLNGVLQAVFALLTLVVVLNAIPIWVKAWRAGGLPTTEAPEEPAHVVAPADFFATKDEKQAVREWEAARAREPVGSRR